MRPIDSALIPVDGSLVVLTSKDIATNSRLFIADFRDMLALVYKPTGSYLGAGHTGIRLGKRPLEMKNGLWLMQEDVELRKTHSDVQVSPDMLALEMIK
jgi:hypothetical protein